MALTARYAVDAPAINDAPVGGLVAVANVQDFTDPHIGQGVAYTTDDCGHAAAAPGWCLSAIQVAGEKEFAGINTIEGDPFAIYKGVECGLGRFDEYEAMAQRGLERGGSYAIERGVQTLLLNGADTVDLTPAGVPVKPKMAVALLEQYAADNYGARPVLHVNRFGATFLPLEVGTPMTTKQGTPVANGGGYSATGPGDVVAGTGEFWMYVSGQVNIWQGSINTVSAPNLVNNTARALAERIIVATVECFVGAIRVTTEGVS